MEGIFWFVLLPLIFVLILSMANLSWDELAVRSWCGREMLNGSILVFALMHPIEFVWFYRGDMKDGPIRMRSFAGLMILFLGVFASTVGSLGKKLTMVDPEPVSYTHLRAHETDSYLVCRLLLEKKKKKDTLVCQHSHKQNNTMKHETQ